MSTIRISTFEQYAINPDGDCKQLGFTEGLVIIAGSVKPRFTAFLELLKQCKTATIVAVSDETDVKRPEQIKFARDYGYSLYSIDEVSSLISDYEKKYLKEQKANIPVLLDVSGLSRSHVGQILAAIKYTASNIPVQLSIIYSLASFAPPPDVWAGQNRAVSPLNSTFSGWTSSPELPVDVVVGLGYEKGKALGAVEYLEPHFRWVFIPNSPEIKYLDQVKSHNTELLKGEMVKQFEYEVLRPADTFFSLHSLLMGLVGSARPVLFPFGPKIFFAISVLVAMTLEEVAVWHVEGEDDDVLSSRRPSKHAVLFRCLLEKADVE